MAVVSEPDLERLPVYFRDTGRTLFHIVGLVPVEGFIPGAFALYVSELDLRCFRANVKPTRGGKLELAQVRRLVFPKLYDLSSGVSPGKQEMRSIVR